MNTCVVLLSVCKSVSCKWFQSNFKSTSTDDDSITAQICDLLVSVSV